MYDEETLARINGKYVPPPDAGPAWLAAMREGIDMSLVEANLSMTPWERLVENDRALALVNLLEEANAARARLSTH
jgi:hypothetical protein